MTFIAFSCVLRSARRAVTQYILRALRLRRPVASGVDPRAPTELAAHTTRDGADRRVSARVADLNKDGKPDSSRLRPALDDQGGHSRASANGQTWTRRVLDLAAWPGPGCAAVALNADRRTGIVCIGPGDREPQVV